MKIAEITSVTVRLRCCLRRSLRLKDGPGAQRAQATEEIGRGRGQSRGWPLNYDALPLNIKGASRFLRKWPLATPDIEPPEA